jgi:hypothetical protein
MAGFELKIKFGMENHKHKLHKSIQSVEGGGSGNVRSYGMYSAHRVVLYSKL